MIEVTKHHAVIMYWTKINGVMNAGETSSGCASTDDLYESLLPSTQPCRLDTEQCKITSIEVAKLNLGTKGHQNHIYILTKYRTPIETTAKVVIKATTSFHIQGLG
jgi:hypothetical protein